MSIIDALLGTQGITGTAPQANALGFPMPAPGTGAQFNLPVTQQQMGVQPQQGPSKFRNFLGALGDALMVGHGGQPLYHQMQEQRQQTNALHGFLQDPDSAIASLMAVPGQAANAIELYKAVHPASETPLEIKLLQHLKDHPEDADMLHQIDAELHPGMMSPVTLGPNDTYEQGGGIGGAPAPGEVTATGPNGAKIRLNPQTGQWEPMGGQTAQPSGGFSGGSMIERNNNPGALRVPGSMRFQSFKSPEQGIQAQHALLGRYMQHGLNNVSSIVERYAPRKSKGGDNSDASVNNYIGYVSQRLGVSPGTPIPASLLPQLAQAMREFETGRRVN